jgi:hypothetical protein
LGRWAASQKEKHIIMGSKKMIMPCTKEVAGSFVKK